MTTRRVLLATITAGFAGGLLVWFFYTHYAPSQWGDFDQVWLGLELVPGVDEIDGDGQARAARFVPCQRHNA